MLTGQGNVNKRKILTYGGKGRELSSIILLEETQENN